MQRYKQTKHQYGSAAVFLLLIHLCVPPGHRPYTRLAPLHPDQLSTTPMSTWSLDPITILNLDTLGRKQTASKNYLQLWLHTMDPVLVVSIHSLSSPLLPPVINDRLIQDNLPALTTLLLLMMKQLEGLIKSQTLEQLKRLQKKSILLGPCSGVCVNIMHPLFRTPASKPPFR